MDKNSDIDILMADVMLRLTCIEQLLVKKGVFSQEEFNEELKDLAVKITEVIRKKANESQSLDDFVKTLSKDN